MKSKLEQDAREKISQASSSHAYSRFGLASLRPINGNMGVPQVRLGCFHEAVATQHTADDAWQGAGKYDAIPSSTTVQRFESLCDVWIPEAIHCVLPVKFLSIP